MIVAPQLDDRRFQDIVDETKKRIPHYCKEWTDHNVSDPGVTLIELFAWMTDIILYRLNQVPDKHTIKFMEMLGIRLLEPIPARAPITFWLSAPQETTVRIPAGTEVASTQTEKEPSIVFSTQADLNIEPPRLAAVLSGLQTGSGERVQYQERNLNRLQTGGEGVDIFSPEPRVGDALYFGFENDLSHHILGFETEWAPGGGAGINPNLPPLVWEASAGAGESRWELCEDGRPEIDSTSGMEVSGRIHVHLPRLARQTVNGKQLFWVRVRVRRLTTEEQQDGMSPYRTTPRLRRVAVTSWGGATVAGHAQHVDRELVGVSDGSPGQRFQLQSTPVLERQPGDTLLVQFDGREQVWEEREDFAESGPRDRHFTLDGVNGEIRLGPAIRQPNGDVKLYGMVPPRDAQLVFQHYRTGGGEAGNVQAGILNTLKTSIPFVTRVANRQPAVGGEDAESLADAMTRAPALLRSRGRAVTESDYEFLAGQALRGATSQTAIGRVKCIQPRPSDAGPAIAGQVYVLIVPRVPDPAGFLSPQQLQPREEDIALLQAYLEERRLLTVRVSVRQPDYRWAAVRVRLRAAPGADQETVHDDVLARLYRYLNPLTGGPDGNGWPFGRDLFEADVSQALQGIANVHFVRKVELFQATPGGAATGNPVESLDVVAHGTIASGRHEVEFV